MKNSIKNSRKKLSGAFTLLELLVVIMILSLLMFFVVPKVMNTKVKAERDMVCNQMGSIAHTLDMFKMDNGMYPETEEGLKALVSNPDSDKYPAYANGGYIKKVPKDSWKQPFQYIKTDNGFDLISFGPDRKEGGTGDNADIKYSNCDK